MRYQYWLVCHDVYHACKVGKCAAVVKVGIIVEYLSWILDAVAVCKECQQAILEEPNISIRDQ